jgi:hypothetical protein
MDAQYTSVAEGSCPGVYLPREPVIRSFCTAREFVLVPLNSKGTSLTRLERSRDGLAVEVTLSMNCTYHRNNVTRLEISCSSMLQYLLDQPLQKTLSNSFYSRENA